MKPEAILAGMSAGLFLTSGQWHLIVALGFFAGSVADAVTGPMRQVAQVAASLIGVGVLVAMSFPEEALLSGLLIMAGMGFSILRNVRVLLRVLRWRYGRKAKGSAE